MEKQLIPMELFVVPLLMLLLQQYPSLRGFVHSFQICVKQFQNIKYQNFDDLIKRAEQERRDAVKQVEDLKKAKSEDAKDQEILALKTQVINLQTELKIQQVSPFLKFYWFLTSFRLKRNTCPN